MVTKLQGAIIAAGSGERLRKSTLSDLPKPLVELGGETMLARQADALMAAGASSVVAVINSETARIADEMQLEIRTNVKLVVRDTDNSMETMLALGEFLEPGWFLAATVDSVIPQPELMRFVNESRKKIELAGDKNLVGVLGVTRWRGEPRPLFADVTEEGLILRLGGVQTRMVTAGVYFLSTRIFDFADRARSVGLDALRRFLAMLIERTHLGAVEIFGAIDVDEAADLDASPARDPEQPMNYRALGIYREPEFSPGKVEADAAIMDATLLELKREGVEIAAAVDAASFANAAPARADIILPMCQGARALKRLAEAEQAGAIAINSALSIRNCYRDLLAPGLERAGVPTPVGVLVATGEPLDSRKLGGVDLSAGVFVKRGDLHALSPEDVQRASDRAEIESILANFSQRRIRFAYLQQEIAGRVVKFYGVSGGSYFSAHPEEEVSEASVRATVGGRFDRGRRARSRGVGW